ncbi:MAG TPA: restriction endonuclease, partial [Lysobacter sp.]|nr:restriction endonuclease [Lysobacter sp.]
MGTLVGFLLAVVVAVAIGTGATWYLQRVKLPREERAEGIAALADMRWRDFIRLILDVLAGRGYARVNDPEAASDEADIPLERDGESWLLSSKHGASYVLGSGDIAEFASAMRMRGAKGGLLVTPGTFAPEARALAEPQRIELLDGPSLWPELRERLSPEQRAAIGAHARGKARQQSGFAWIAGIVVGAAVFFLFPGGGGSSDSQSNMTTPVVATTPKPTAAPVPAVPAAIDVEPAPRDIDPATLERNRKDVANAIGSLPMVDRALWSTQSTLLVYLAGTGENAKSAICPLLERYPELGASRVQLQPPQGSA